MLKRVALLIVAGCVVALGSITTSMAATSSDSTSTAPAAQPKLRPVPNTMMADQPAPATLRIVLPTCQLGAKNNQQIECECTSGELSFTFSDHKLILACQTSPGAQQQAPVTTTPATTTTPAPTQ